MNSLFQLCCHIISVFDLKLGFTVRMMLSYLLTIRLVLSQLLLYSRYPNRNFVNLLVATSCGVSALFIRTTSYAKPITSTSLDSFQCDSPQTASCPLSESYHRNVWTTIISSWLEAPSHYKSLTSFVLRAPNRSINLLAFPSHLRLPSFSCPYAPS